MSNKTQLQTNNTQLASLIQTLQGKAAGGGSGGSVETCTVTFTSNDPVMANDNYTMVYMGEDFQAHLEVWTPNETTITAVKGSPITIFNWTSYSTAENATLIKSSAPTYVYSIDGDAVFDFVM